MDFGNLFNGRVALYSEDLTSLKIELNLVLNPHSA